MTADEFAATLTAINALIAAAHYATAELLLMTTVADNDLSHEQVLTLRDVWHDLLKLIESEVPS